MTLNCQHTNDTLHRCGNEILRHLLEDELENDPFQRATKPEEEPLIPTPEIFVDQDRGVEVGLDPRVPTISQCATHLELLETFFILKEKLIRSEAMDEAMDTQPVREIKTGYYNDTKTLKDETLEERRKSKWPKFVEFAVLRFFAWRASLSEEETRKDDNNGSQGGTPGDINLSSQTGIQQQDIKGANPTPPDACQEETKQLDPEQEGKNAHQTDSPSQSPQQDRSTNLLAGTTTNGENNLPTKDTPKEPPNIQLKSLPPLDVLLVWHSLLLNPLLLRSNCLSEPLYRIPFPWKEIHASINIRDWSFAATTTTTTTTASPSTNSPPFPLNLAPDLLAFLETPQLKVGHGIWSPPLNQPTQPGVGVTEHAQLFTRYAVLPFAEELKAAVLRQTAFAEKMHGLLWIRSPYLGATLRRARERYDKFLVLLKEGQERGKRRMLVPALV